MNDFERNIIDIHSTARNEMKNINIGIVALGEIYDNLTEDQKKDNDLINMFIVVLNNLNK